MKPFVKRSELEGEARMPMATQPNQSSEAVWSFGKTDLELATPLLCAEPRSPSTGALQTGQPVIYASSHPSAVTTFALDLSPAGVVSSPLKTETVRTVGCLFEQGARSRERGVRREKPHIEPAKREINTAGRSDSMLPAPGSELIGRTRIRPPRDLVKLEDRLRLLLQPPLESLLAAKSLRFTFPPFAYQLDGVAFLYPRYEAVLADEMGLGKTMQAVTAIRLLAHHGQLRRVLLACPKPLMTNW